MRAAVGCQRRSIIWPKCWGLQMTGVRIHDTVVRGAQNEEEMQGRVGLTGTYFGRTA